MPYLTVCAGPLLAITTLAALAGCGGPASTTAPSSSDAGVPDSSLAPEAGTADAAMGTAACLPRAHSCTFKGFATAVVYPTANEPLSILAVDRTCSGHLDLVVGERTGMGAPTSELFANAGDGTFVASSSYGASGNYAGNMVAADFNGDGRIDLASQSNGTYPIDIGTDGGALGIDFGSDAGAFAPQLALTPTPETTGYLAAGDFNGDGRPDIAFAGYHEIEATGGAVGDSGLIATPGPEAVDPALNVFFNAGNGTFAAPVAYVGPGESPSIATGDFNGDGHLDIAQLGGGTGAEGAFSVFFNAGDGTFRNEVTFVASTGWVAYGLGVADFNGDGKDDVATTTILNPNQSTESIVLEVFTGAGNDTFNGPAMYGIVDVPSVYQVVTGDFNGDGKPDLAMVIGSSPTTGFIEPTPVSVFENLGDGTFGAPVIYTVGGQLFEYATAIAAGDFNGDGVTDLAVTTDGEETPTPIAVNVLLSQCE
jgi:hypothetical protein